ncbi:MAG: CotH kinase family protein [Blautia sp.]|nr:CotH kinase family protein [Blautia sp.]MCM1201443.1 CotH kinase family protein [Bacteroides fragilis]
MVSRKRIALCGIAAVFAVFAVWMNDYTKEAAGRGGTANSYGLCINEVCSDYFPASFAETQPPSDWIELYNFSDTGKNLGDYYLSDDKDDLYKYNLPAVELPPGGYYTIHSACEEMTEEEAKLNFGIKSQGGDTLYLSNDTKVIDVVKIPALDANTSWSRLADAGSEWGITELSYRTSNAQAEMIPGKTQEPVFSVEGGFYAEEFELELKAPEGSRIYYTLDGSDPDTSGILYEKPIPVRNVSAEPNVYSARNDFDPERSAPPEAPVEKIMVVRAAAFDAAGRKSDIVTNSYLVGKEDMENYREMYTVSLVTDPDNLFDEEEGIYVLGKKYDGYVPAGDDDLEIQDANYQIHGKRSERPASIEIFDENGGRILDREAGVRIHGNTTRHCTQKTFSVYAREMYDGSDTIEGLFEADKAVHKFFLYTNTEGSKLKDMLIAETLSGRDVATPALRYCNVFLDGEYWGIYLLEEVYDEYYFENHYGIAADNIQIHEGANPPDIVEYLNTVPDQSDPAVYEQLCQMMDIQSFIDYYAAMLYLNDIDWLDYNARCYRSTEAGSGEKEDGKWRWAVWDVETTMFEAYLNTFYTGVIRTWQDDPIAQALMEHEAFREKFVTTYMDLYNNLWREDHILPCISEKTGSMEASFEMYMERFHAGTDTHEYHGNVERFFTERGEYAFAHLKEEFALEGEPAWLVILSDQSGAASYRVNTSVVDMPETWWQGVYFADYPVEIAVEEVEDGRTFLGWYTENDELISTERAITVDLTGETTVVNAKFAAEPVLPGDLPDAKPEG